MKAAADIRNRLAATASGDFPTRAAALLAEMGYRSTRTLLGQSGDVGAFLERFPATNPNTQSEQAFRDNAKSAWLLFQLTDTEIERSAQGILFDFDSFAESNAKSFLFIAVELEGDAYPRGRYAAFTREINKRLSQPAVVLFRTTGNLLTLAFVHRREHKHDPDRDVLGSVSLVREIDPLSPHRAHLDILADLSLAERLAWMQTRGKPISFDGLLAAWLDALDTEELNRRFYRELSDWFGRAVEEATFPTDQAITLQPEEHLIRLITRLLFVWFMKEKGLVAGDLFVEARVNDLLKGYDRESGDASYYRAVLQNLFFATLNTEMDKRGFSRAQNATHRNFSLYRYEREIAEPDKLLALFAQTPFINGGLFDCLDSEAATTDGGYRIDCFTDNVTNPRSNDYGILSIPNRLFFDEGGLIPLFERYKFTVEENTPVEQEVALDPELLGKVFENLLAAYNPETRETARKQTGSYYTPRVVVDYMVDEALKQCLKQKVERTFLSAHAQITPTAAPSSIIRTHDNAPPSPPLEKGRAIYWITFRLADAIPQDKLRAQREARNLWLKRHPKPWSERDWNDYDQRFGAQTEAWLDAGMGSRALARPDAREIVKNSLLRFDGERLRLHAAVIMPTHVHLLLEPLRSHDLSRILQGIKGASARELNNLLGTTGTFWLDESYDHIVRSEEQYWRLIRYIANSPLKAGLGTDEYWHYQGVADIPVRDSEEGCRENGQNGQTGMSVPPSLAERLDQLVSYLYEPPDFTEAETEALVRAIAELKVLDPAVGSGAFPMAVLHKLTLALKRLDPDNTHWEALQKERATERVAAAFDAPSQQERDNELAEISETFERYRDSDFGRKLYLMQNSIFGVDIQPVACQIAKLRFFISLAIEQEPDRNADNFGIKPLPNLETRFVAADTLLHLKTAAQLDLFRQQIESLKTRLAENRERHFHATTRRQKLACKEKDGELRQELAEVLHAAGLPENDANKIAQWDPYDQNAKAAWFDAEYMLDSQEGFDVVIGNPPYMQLQKNSGDLGNRYKDSGYATFARTGDLYQLFYEKGCQLLKPRHGLLAYITSNSWLKAEYGKATRRYFAGRHTPLRLLEMGKDMFENTIVDTSILLLREGAGSDDKANPIIAAVDMDQLAVKDFPPDASLWGQTRPDGEKPWSILSLVEHRVMEKMQAIGTPLKDWDVRINRGITTGCNDAFIIDDATRRALIAEDPKSAEIIKPVLRGRDIQRYQAEWAGMWLIATFPPLQLDIEDYPAVKEYLLFFGKDRLEQSGKTVVGGGKSRKRTQHAWFELQDATAYHEDFAKEKLIWMDLTDRGRFAYDDNGMFCVNTAFVMSGHSIKFLCAILNANLTTYFMNRTALNSGMGVTRWIRTTVETIPIPKIPAAEQRPFIRLVDAILTARAADPSADTREQEAGIDRLVYGLYGLTAKEVAAVEGTI